MESIDDDGGRARLRLGDDPRDVRLREDEQPLLVDPEAPAAQAHLRRRFLRARVEHVARLDGQTAPGLQQQRRLADPRLAAEQNDRPRDEAAPEHAVEAVEARSSGGPVARRRSRRSRPPDARRAPAPRARPRRAPPRRTSSTRRIPGSGPATSATPTRRPGRQRRSWPSRPSSGPARVHARDARPDAAQDLVGDRSGGRGEVPRRHRLRRPASRGTPRRRRARLRSPSRRRA